MSKVPGGIECTECGALIDIATDTPDKRAPCPNCGSVKRTVKSSASGMQPTNYLLDNFVAHKLSLLTECGVRELPTEANWLGAFILTTVFTATLPAKNRVYVFNFLRRAEGAFSAYREARSALIEYLATPRNVLSPYFRDLLNFEVCIAQCYQGYELLATGSGEKLFERNDRSDGERLHYLYVDSKHMDRMIDGGKLPTEATVAVWITNHGLESNRAALSFDELFEMLIHMGRLAEQLSTLTAGPVDDSPNPAVPATEATTSAISTQ
jgi:predicted RNA-binding Zn-ribbon protein involved in translation (DUF1610 family)